MYVYVLKTNFGMILKANLLSRSSFNSINRDSCALDSDLKTTREHQNFTTFVIFNICPEVQKPVLSEYAEKSFLHVY